MNLSNRLLHFGCAAALVCLFTACDTAGQSTELSANRVTQVPDDNARVTLRGNVHPLARDEFGRGAVADSVPMERILLLLKRSDAQDAALQSLMEAQQDKSSPSYHKWLTPDEFGKRFGVSDADVQAVCRWLSAQGFQSVRVAAGRTVIEFSGSAGQVRQAFGTQIQNYSVNGSLYIANATDPQIPAALAQVVAGVVSLHNFPRKSHSKFRGDVQRTSSQGALQPLFTFPNPFGGSGNFYGVGPGDFATIYNSKTLISGGNDGTGQTIAIVGETQIDPTDVSDFRAMFGLTGNFTAANVILNGMDPGITSTDEESEADLDVQWSGAVAPGATVKFVVSASTPASSGIDLSALYIVEHNLADVVSESYGDCESALGSAGNAFYNGLWEQAAAQGITVVVSSGDGGSAGCDDFNANPPVPAKHGLAVSGLAGTPFNVSVGGTDFNQTGVWSTYWSDINDAATGTSAKSYIPEIPWNENCAQLGLSGCGSTAPKGSVNIVAGSGGPSSVYAKPKWQMGVAGVPTDNHRDQPDISLFASPGFAGSGYLVCQKDLTGVQSCNLNSATYTFHIIGGTSASAPAFAGVMALVNQYAAVHGGSSRQGNANVTLYALAKKSGASCASSASEAAGCIFNDVATGNSYLATKYGKSVGTNSVPCAGGTPNCSSTISSTTGVLVDPSKTTTEAWTAGAGYDMATGLGSLNIHNLATSWGSASTIGTATTLSLSPTTGITHGQTENVGVTVSVKANTGSGIPAGDVALIATFADGSTHGLDQFTLINGAVASVKTQDLPGGTYTVYAHYAGDGTNAPSDSAPVQVTVGKEASQTFIVVPTFDSQGNQTSGNANSIVYGTPYIIRMYVANGSAVANSTGPPAPTCAAINEVTCPTGTVALSANGATIDGGSYSLNNEGYTRDIAPTLTGGTYPLVANYGGDNSYTASTAATDMLTITPTITTMSVPYIPYSPEIVGTPVNISSFLVSNNETGVAPTGTIAFFDGTSQIAGTVTYNSRPGQRGALDASITGSMTVTFTNSGTHSITAQYRGDASYSPSTSSPLNATVLYPTAMSLSPNNPLINLGSSVTITASVSSGTKSPAMTGQIAFYLSGALASGSASTSSTDGSGNQELTATLTISPQQLNQVVQAVYQGDANFQTASNVATVLVNIPDFTLPQNTVITVAAGQTQTAIINVTPLSNTPSSVTFSAPYAYSLPSGMSITFSPSTVNLAGAAVPVTLTLSTIGPSGGPVAAAKRGKAAIFFPPSGRSWWTGSLASALLLVLFLWIPRKRYRYGAVSLATSALLITAALGCGGGTGGGGGGGAGGPAPTTITLATSNAKIAGGVITLTATVNSSQPTTGTVNIFQGPLGQGSGIDAPFALVGGKAGETFTPGMNPGIYPYWANYSGDANNLPSQSTTTVQQVITGSVNASLNAQTAGLSHPLNLTINLQ